MIKLIQGQSLTGKDWKLEIDGNIIEKVKVGPIIGNKVHFYVWTHKTPKIFLQQSFDNIKTLLPTDDSQIEITVYAKDAFADSKWQLFPDDLLPEELKDRIDPEDKLSFFLTIAVDRKNEVVVEANFALLILGAQFWKYPFSLYEFLRKSKTFLKNNIIENRDDLFIGQFKFTLPSYLSIEEGYNLIIADLDSAFDQAFQILSNSIGRPSLLTRFVSFPEEIRVPCEQYLLYFTEFLRDLGINVTSDIKHEAGEVLFSVTPNDSNQALHKIKVALDAFLRLPNSEIIFDPTEEFEIAMLKTKANIDHLNSQLSLAKAEIKVRDRELQALDAVLEAKDISIEFLREKLMQQRLLLNGEMAEAVIDVEHKPTAEDKEEFFDGVFALTQYEGKGFRVSLAHLYRKLRDYFQRT